MKVKLIKDCYVDGEACKAGKVVDTARANLLIGMGKAEKYEEPVKKPKKAGAKDTGNKAAGEQHER